MGYHRSFPQLWRPSLSFRIAAVFGAKADQRFQTVDRPFQCECQAPECLKVIDGASNMDLSLLEARGYFINDHILELLQERGALKN